MTARCRCSHGEDAHTVIRGKTVCVGSVVCGCGEYRPDDGNRWPPARFRDTYDPSEPIDRQVK